MVYYETTEQNSSHGPCAGYLTLSGFLVMAVSEAARSCLHSNSCIQGSTINFLPSSVRNVPFGPMGCASAALVGGQQSGGCHQAKKELQGL